MLLLLLLLWLLPRWRLLVGTPSVSDERDTTTSPVAVDAAEETGATDSSSSKKHTVERNFKSSVYKVNIESNINFMHTSYTVEQTIINTAIL